MIEMCFTRYTVSNPITSNLNAYTGLQVFTELDRPIQAVLRVKHLINHISASSNSSSEYFGGPAYVLRFTVNV